MDVVPCLPEGQVRVWMFYQAYQEVGYGTADCIRTRTRPRVIKQGRTRYQGTFPWAIPNSPKCRVQVGKLYQAYQSVEYGYGCRTELTKGSGTGMDDIPSLPRGRVRV